MSKKKSAGRPAKYKAKTVVRSYRCPENEVKKLDQWVKLFLDKCKIKKHG